MEGDRFHVDGRDEPEDENGKTRYLFPDNGLAARNVWDLGTHDLWVKPYFSRSDHEHASPAST